MLQIAEYNEHGVDPAKLRTDNTRIRIRLLYKYLAKLKHQANIQFSIFFFFWFLFFAHALRTALNVLNFSSAFRSRNYKALTEIQDHKNLFNLELVFV